MEYVWEKFRALPAERKALCLFIPVFLMAIIFAWYNPTPAPPNKGFTEPPKIPGTDVPKVDRAVKGGKVKVIPKEDVDDALDPLPEELKADNIEILNTADLSATETGYEVISSINTDTGDTKIIAKEKKPDLWDFENKKRIGVGYGYSTEGTVARVMGEYTFLRVGNFHLGVQAEINAVTLKAPDAKALAVIDYRF